MGWNASCRPSWRRDRRRGLFFPCQYMHMHTCFTLISIYLNLPLQTLCSHVIFSIFFGNPFAQLIQHSSLFFLCLFPSFPRCFMCHIYCSVLISVFLNWPIDHINFFVLVLVVSAINIFFSGFYVMRLLINFVAQLFKVYVKSIKLSMLIGP